MREKGESAFDDVVDEDSDKDQEPVEEENQQDSAEQSSPSTGSDSDTETAVSVEESEPGFPFSVAEQHPVYLQEDAWQSLQDTKYYTEGELLEQFGVRNAETREFDQAIAELVVEELSPEQIATKIVENRGFE